MNSINKLVSLSIVFGCLYTTAAFSMQKNFETDYGLVTYRNGNLYHREKQILPTRGSGYINTPYISYTLKEPGRETIIFNAGSNGCPTVLYAIQLSSNKSRAMQNLGVLCNEGLEVNSTGSVIKFRQTMVGENDHITEFDVETFTTHSYEQAVRKVSSNPYELENEHPLAVVTSRHWKPRFMRLLGRDYKRFSEQVSMASPVKQQGNWVIGNGWQKYTGLRGGFAIDKLNNEIIAAIFDGQGGVTTYGISSFADTPSSFRNWILPDNRASYPDELFVLARQLFNQERYTEATQAFHKSAVFNNIESYKALYYMYFLGYGVEKDDSIAAYWLEKSAESGDIDSQEALRVYNQRLSVTDALPNIVGDKIEYPLKRFQANDSDQNLHYLLRALTNSLNSNMSGTQLDAGTIIESINYDQASKTIDYKYKLTPHASNLLQDSSELIDAAGKQMFEYNAGNTCSNKFMYSLIMAYGVKVLHDFQEIGRVLVDSQACRELGYKFQRP